MKSLKIPKG